MSAAKMVADSTQGDFDEPKKKRKRKKEREKEKSKKLKKKDSRKGKSRKMEDDDSDLDLDKELLPIGDYIKDHQEMNEQLFHCLRGPVLQKYVPEVLKELTSEELKKRCLEHLEIMSKKRIRRILAGDDPSMISSSGTEEESSADDQEVGQNIEENNRATEEKESDVYEVKGSDERGSGDDQNSDLEDENRSGDETGRDTQSSDSEVGEAQADELEEGDTLSDVEEDVDENGSGKDDDEDERSEDGDTSMKSDEEVSSDESVEEQEDEKDESDVENDKVKDTLEEICEKEVTEEEKDNVVKEKETKVESPSRSTSKEIDSENETGVNDSELTQESDVQTYTSETVIATDDCLNHSASVKGVKDSSFQIEEDVSNVRCSVSHNGENDSCDSKPVEQNNQSDKSIKLNSPNQSRNDNLTGDKDHTSLKTDKIFNDIEDAFSFHEDNMSLVDNPLRELFKSPVNDATVSESPTFDDRERVSPSLTSQIIMDTSEERLSKPTETSNENASTKKLTLKTKSDSEKNSKSVQQKIGSKQSGDILRDSQFEADTREVELSKIEIFTSNLQGEGKGSNSRSVILSSKPVMAKTESLHLSVETRLGPVKQTSMVLSSSSCKSVHQRLGPLKNISKTSPRPVSSPTVVSKEPLSKSLVHPKSSSSQILSKSVSDVETKPSSSKSVSKALNIESKPSSIKSAPKASSQGLKPSLAKSVSKISSKQLPESSSKDSEEALAPVLTKNQMELLELEMRARAIKAMLAAHEKKEAELQKEAKN